MRETWRIQNDFMQQLALQGEIAGTPYTMHILLREGCPLIRISLEIQWPHDVRIGEPYEGDWLQSRRAFYDTRYMLSALFPAAISRPRLSKDAPFDVCESRQASTFYNRWDSIRHNVILHWVDLSAEDGNTGMTLLSDHTTSYSYGPDYPLALTVQYAGPGLWGRQYPTHGTTNLNFALYPHEGDWEQPLPPLQCQPRACEQPPPHRHARNGTHRRGPSGTAGAAPSTDGPRRGAGGHRQPACLRHPDISNNAQAMTIL